MTQIQNIIDKCTDSDCHLPKELYYAPLVITRPCKIFGNGSIILCNNNNSIVIDSDNVELYDLKIEQISETASRFPAVICKQSTCFHNVIVNGIIKKDNKISDDKSIPKVINLGMFKANSEALVTFDIFVDEECTITSDNNDLFFSPDHLVPGLNNISLKINGLRNNTIIYTDILLTGTITKIFSIIGKFTDEIETNFPTHIDTFNHMSSLVSVHSPPFQFLPPEVSSNNFTYMNKGQRVILEDTEELIIQLEMDAQKKALDIDGYAYILNWKGKADSDQDLVFWGNAISADKSVELISSNNTSHFLIRINNISNRISKLVICYAIYGSNPDDTFKYIKNPYIRLFTNGFEKYRFNLVNLNQEKTIVAVEIYNHNGNWKIKCVGSGYHAGLKKLCEDYGIEIAD